MGVCVRARNQRLYAKFMIIHNSFYSRLSNFRGWISFLRVLLATSNHLPLNEKKRTFANVHTHTIVMNFNLRRVIWWVRVIVYLFTHSEFSSFFLAYSEESSSTSSSFVFLLSMCWATANNAVTGAGEKQRAKKKKRICQNDKITIFIGYFLNLLLGVPNFLELFEFDSVCRWQCECVVASISIKRNLHMCKYTWKVQTQSDSTEERTTDLTKHTFANTSAAVTTKMRSPSIDLCGYYFSVV